jgi:hypothetical protein
MRFTFYTALLFSAFFLGLHAPETLAAPPTNDHWINRIQISPAQLIAGFNDNQNLAEASVESTDPGLPCVIGNPRDRGNTAWYGLTTAANELYLKASSGEGFDSVMLLVTGTPGNFKTVVGGCNDEGAANSGSALDGLKLAANTSYSIMIARPNQSAEDAPLNFAASLAVVKRVVDPQNSLLGFTVGLFNLTVSGGGGPNFVGTGGCINTSIQAGSAVGAGPPNEFLVLSNV